MKKLLSLVMSVAISFAVAAQTENQTTRTIRGAVLDSNGNPLPGAIVSATGGAETSLVESDGTFVLEIPIWLKSVTASYAGYKNKKMKPQFNQDMIFNLKLKQPSHVFLNAFVGITFYDGEADGAVVGLMGGLLSNVGFYIKAGYNTGGLAVGGVTKRLFKNIYAYLGVGYCSLISSQEYTTSLSPGGGYSMWTEYYTDPGMAFDGGFIFKFGKHFDCTIGYTHTIDFWGEWNCTPNLSLGYVF